MRSVSLSAACADLDALIDAAVGDKVPVVIRSRPGEGVVMIAQSEWARIKAVIGQARGAADRGLTEERLLPLSDRDVAILGTEANPAGLVDALRQLWAQGEASGAAVEGSFDADKIARCGERRQADRSRGD